MTTVVIFGPLIILIARAQKVTPIPFLLAAALLSDTGGVATLGRRPPDLMIVFRGKYLIQRFAIHMFPPVLIAWVGVLVLLKYLFKEELAQIPEDVSIIW